VRDAKSLQELNDRLPKFGEVVRGPKRARLRNFMGLGKPVYLRWDLNRAAIEDQIFEIQIGKETARLDWEEVLHYLRDV
jgi:hypothetical protein